MSHGPQSEGRRRPGHGLPWTPLLSVELALEDIFTLLLPVLPSPWAGSDVWAASLQEHLIHPSQLESYPCSADQGYFSSSPPAAQEG